MAGEVMVEMNDNFSKNNEENSFVSGIIDGMGVSPRPRAALAFMEVSDIVAASFGENGKRCYKVHWKDSWVYHDHLFDCQELIAQFWNHQTGKTDQVNNSSKTCDGTKEVVKSNQARNTKTNDNVTVIVMSENDAHSENEHDNDIDTDWGIGVVCAENDNDPKDTDWTMENYNSKRKRSAILNVKRRDVLSCHICGDEFDMVAAIRRHYSENHPGAKPFACNVCDKRFDRKENLNRHIRIHTGDRRYVCTHCGKGYTDPSGLKKHVMSKHSNASLSCTVCNTTFKLKDSLNRHLTKHLTELKNKKIDVNDKSAVLPPDGDAVVFISKQSADIEMKENSSQLQSVLTEQQFPDSGGQVQVQYISHHSPEIIENEENKDLEKENNGGKVVFTKTEDQDNFVLPITAQNILSMTSTHNSPASQHLVSPNGNTQQLLSIPIVSSGNFEYTTSIKLADSQSENLL